MEVKLVVLQAKPANCFLMPVNKEVGYPNRDVPLDFRNGSAIFAREGESAWKI